MAGERLVNIMNQVRNEDKSDTTDLLFGIVTSTSPLKIKVENRFEVSEEFLMLSAMCKEMTITTLAHNHDISTTVNQNGSHTHSTPAAITGDTTVGSFGSHTHSIPANTTGQNGTHDHSTTSTSSNELTSITLWRGLQVNDKVRMLRVSKGQLYYVLEREEWII